MSIGNTLIGGGLLAAMLQAAWVAVSPFPPPIVIHSLTYQDGMVIQDRTVKAATKFAAVWTAEIVDATTGAVVAGCSGGGAWDYVPGRKAVEMTVQEWVGSPTCDVPAGKFYPRSTYKAGEFYISERGEIFEVNG